MKSGTRREESLVVALGARAVQWSAGALACLVLLAGVGTAGLSFYAAEKLVHPPREMRDATPGHRGLEFERVSFTADDGVRLVGWWMPAQHATGTVVFLHGYGASKWQSLSVAPFLVEAGFNVLAFDFRAHGESGGAYTTVGLDEAKDVRAAVRFAQAMAGAEEPIALFGWSMGAAAALNAVGDLPEVRAVVADSAFASLSNVVGSNLGRFTGLPEFPFVPLIMLFASSMAGHSAEENEPARGAASITRPLLVIQGARDDIANPQGDGAALATAGGAMAQFWLVDDAGHVDASRAEPREYEARVVGFLRESLA